MRLLQKHASTAANASPAMTIVRMPLNAPSKETTMLKRLWCYFRGHPYPWVYICEPDDWILNSMPPSKCSNCGCTSH